MEEVGVDMNSWILPLDVEVEGVGDREVSIIDDEHIADMNLNFYEIWLKQLEIYTKANKNVVTSATKIFFSCSFCIYAPCSVFLPYIAASSYSYRYNPGGTLSFFFFCYF